MGLGKFVSAVRNRGKNSARSTPTPPPPESQSLGLPAIGHEINHSDGCITKIDGGLESGHIYSNHPLYGTTVHIPAICPNGFQHSPHQTVASHQHLAPQERANMVSHTPHEVDHVGGLRVPSKSPQAEQMRRSPKMHMLEDMAHHTVPNTGVASFPVPVHHPSTFHGGAPLLRSSRGNSPPTHMLQAMEQHSSHGGPMTFPTPQHHTQAQHPQFQHYSPPLHHSQGHAHSAPIHHQNPVYHVASQDPWHQGTSHHVTTHVHPVQTLTLHAPRPNHITPQTLKELQRAASLAPRHK